MACDIFDDLIEAVAAGETAATPVFQDHLTSCARCAAALALARRIDEALRVREAPAPPARFTASVIGRLRRERWRSEQSLDRMFNVAVAAAAALVVTGIWLLLNASGMTAVSAEASRILAAGIEAARDRIQPLLPAYAGGTALLVTAVGLWWWAERRLSL
jgi:anti-sigma factor RsiW